MYNYFTHTTMKCCYII